MFDISIFCSSYWYFKKAIIGPIFFFLIEIWDHKWIYLECSCQSPFLQFSLSLYLFIFRAVSLMLNSWIWVLLLFTLTKLTYSIWLSPSWHFISSSFVSSSSCLQFHCEVYSSTMPMIILSHMCSCNPAAVLEFPTTATMAGYPVAIYVDTWSKFTQIFNFILR